MPPLAPPEYEALKADIRENGVAVSSSRTSRDISIDEHNRFKAWRELMEAGVDLGPIPRWSADLSSDQEKRDEGVFLNYSSV
jgi:hypothetical protein